MLAVTISVACKLFVYQQIHVVVFQARFHVSNVLGVLHAIFCQCCYSVPLLIRE